MRNRTHLGEHLTSSILINVGGHFYILDTTHHLYAEKKHRKVTSRKGLHSGGGNRFCPEEVVKASQKQRCSGHMSQNQQTRQRGITALSKENVSKSTEAFFIMLYRAHCVTFGGLGTNHSEK